MGGNSKSASMIIILKEINILCNKKTTMTSEIPITTIGASGSTG